MNEGKDAVARRINGLREIMGSLRSRKTTAIVPKRFFRPIVPAPRGGVNDLTATVTPFAGVSICRFSARPNDI